MPKAEYKTGYKVPTKADPLNTMASGDSMQNEAKKRAKDKKKAKPSPKY